MLIRANGFKKPDILYLYYLTICQTRDRHCSMFFPDLTLDEKKRNQKKSEQEFHSPEDHEGHPDQEDQGLLVDPLSHYSHPLLENQAHHLLLGVPEQYSTVMVGK